MQDFLTAAPISDAGALEMRDDYGGVRVSADVKGFLHGFEDGVGFGAHVSGVYGIRSDEGLGEGEHFFGSSSVGIGVG